MLSVELAVMWLGQCRSAVFVSCGAHSWSISDGWCLVVRPLDNDDSESGESQRSKEGSDWPASQDSASLSVDDDVTERVDDDSRQTAQQQRLEVNEAKRAKLREIEVRSSSVMMDWSVWRACLTGPTGGRVWPVGVAGMSDRSVWRACNVVSLTVREQLFVWNRWNDIWALKWCRVSVLYSSYSLCD